MKFKRRKFCGCGCGERVKGRFVLGHNLRTEESKLFFSKLTSNREWSNSSLLKLSESLKKHVQTEEHKKRNSESIRALWKDPKFRNKIIKAQKLGNSSPEVIKKKSQQSKDRWKNLEFVKKMQLGLSLHPNKPETLLLNLLNELYPNEWKFTGDFSFMINGKNPDFVNCNGQKKCIELFGDYYHKGQNPQDRKDIFKEFGYGTLVIWEHELKNMNRVKFRIHKFHNKGENSCQTTDFEYHLKESP